MVNKSLISESLLGKAFTLAEVLIVIGIIGIVAQMTIPTLVQNYQKTQYVSGLKKAYTSLQQWYDNYVVDEGVSGIGDTELFDGTTAFSDDSRRDKMDAVIRKYFRVIKSCVRTSDTSCDSSYKYLTRSGSLNRISGTFYSFDSADGMRYKIYLMTACPYDSNSPTKTSSSNCGLIEVDVNGNSPPNQVGKDYHPFYIGNIGIYPVYGESGAKGDAYKNGLSDWTQDTLYWKKTATYCGKPNEAITTNDVSGWCTARIMENGWVMDY